MNVKGAWTKDKPIIVTDPYRRLLAAVVLRAVKDYLAPPKTANWHEIASAADFCHNEIDLIAWVVGCSKHKIEAILAGGAR